MKKESEYMRFDELGRDVLSFWRECVKERDRINVLTRSPEWYAMMAEGREGAFVTLFPDDEGAPCGVMPLIPVKAPWGGEMLKVVGGELIAGRNCRERVIPGLIASGLSRRPGWDVVYFDHLSGTQLQEIKAGAGAGGYSVMTLYESLPHYRLVLPEAREGLAGLSTSRTRQKIRAAERTLMKELGGLELLDISSYDELVKYKQPLELMMNSTWQAEKLGHGFCVENMKQVAERGWMRCFVLKGVKKIIAFAACYQGMGTLVYEIVGYDQDYREYSPGKILLHRLLRRLYDENKPDYVDFGEGEAMYKSGMANDEISTNNAYVYFRRMRMGGACRLYFLKNTLSRICREVFKKWRY